LDGLLSGLCDGTISDDDRAGLGRRIAAEPAVRRTYLHYVDLHAALSGQAAGAAPPALTVAPVTGPAAEPTVVRLPSRRALWGLLAAGAAAAVSAALVYGPWRRSEPVDVDHTWHAWALPPALLKEITGDVVVQNPTGESLDVAVGGAVAGGNVVRTVSDDGFAALGFRDGTRLELNGETQVRLSADSRSVVLTAGVLRGSTPAGAGEPTMVIMTPQAEIHASRDTRFTVWAAGPETTEVETEIGMVRIVRVSDGRAVDVPAGSYALALSGEPLLSVRPQPTVVTQPTRRLEFPRARGIAFAPDGRRLTAVASNRWASLHLPSGNPVLPAVEFPENSERVFVSADAGRVMIVGRDKRLRVFDTAGGNELPGIDPGSSANWAWAASADGSLVAAGHNVSGPPDLIRLWRSGAEIAPLKIDSPTRCIAVSADGALVAAGMDRGRKGSPEHRLAVWNVADGRRLLTVTVPESPLRVLRLSDDGRRIAGACENGTVRLWDAQTGVELAALDASDGWTRPVRALAFSPDGRLLAVGTADGRVRIRDTGAGRETAVLDAGRRGVSALAFSPDGRTLAVGSPGGPITLWDVPAVRGPVGPERS
jgi:WD40 repeat protein